MKKYGYFGEGLEGYMHYKLAFDRNFNEKDDNNFDSLDEYDACCDDDYDFGTDYESDDE